MRIIRILGNITLWIGAILGVVAGAVWGAGQLGIVQPLIVISGSMEPGIMTGDLLIDRPVATESVEIGDIVSLPSELTGKLVTHRVTAVARQDDAWQIRMKGDDNADEDLEPYTVGEEVLTPFLRIPRGGSVVSTLMEPNVAVPILVALIALLGVSLLDEEPRRVIRRTVERVARRNPRLDELDRELAAVGIDVSRFEQMDDLDLALLSVGIDVSSLDARPDKSRVRDDEPPPPTPDPDASEQSDVHRRRSLDREPALTG